MGCQLRYLALLAASPLVAFALHAAMARVFGLAAPSLPPHLVAGLSVLLGYPAIAAAAWVLCPAVLGSSDWGFWARLYGWAVYSGLAFCYFQVYNMSETARRIHILYEIRLRPELTARELEARYAPAGLLAVRLERLLSWGTLVESNGRYRVGGLFLWGVAKVMAGWGRVLGFSPVRSWKDA